ncbi:Fe-S protein assembly co-chaperone HscB [Buchnera aphidicola]|uniref:Co-chaperone protein HscB n=1 Tax=Buchnera aphidicola (Cinara curvipes) TaxID=2518975 RepID=A0A451D740_9GAMM|nr:Fe-S protein assembly co-chaperone HscB [Buchnera aphidicola]VFP81671.1 Co-chaperone protein HscB [Buchnera aphidicola (Cinara curvipes)]
MNYFHLFQLPQQFEIDKQILINTFYELQKKYHPDMCNKKILHKKNQLSMAIKINQGFNILNNKFTRANYLLKIYKKKFSFKENHTINEKEILLEKFKLYEKIQKIKNKPNSYKKINFFIKKIKNKLSFNFQNFNKNIKEKKINSANKIFFHISFIYKILQKLKKIKKIMYKKKEKK